MSIFQTTIETRELHKKDKLRTHYYRNNFDQVKKALEQIAEEDNMQVQNVNRQYGDIYIIADGYEVICSVIQITPIETSVDFKINYFSTFGWGRPEKKAIHLYERLDALLSFKGTLLHP